jgi:hypothetical protein
LEIFLVCHKSNSHKDLRHLRRGRMKCR